MKASDNNTPRQFYHGTRADLKAGDLISAGYSSNYGARKQASWIYLIGTLDAAIWGTELAGGDERELDPIRRSPSRPAASATVANEASQKTALDPMFTGSKPSCIPGGNHRSHYATFGARNENNFSNRKCHPPSLVC
jgi:hypothetical protein